MLLILHIKLKLVVSPIIFGMNAELFYDVTEPRNKDKSHHIRQSRKFRFGSPKINHAQREDNIKKRLFRNLSKTCFLCDLEKLE